MSHTCSVLHFLEMSHKYEKGNVFYTRHYILRERMNFKFVNSKIFHLLVIVMYRLHALGKAILHKISIYYEYICLCQISTLFDMICLFSKFNKSSTTRLRS